MTKLKDLIENENNRRASKAKNAGKPEETFFMEKGGLGKTIVVRRPGDDMSIAGQLRRLGYEVLDGNLRLSAMLSVNRQALVICDGKYMLLNVSDLGIVTLEDTPLTSLIQPIHLMKL